MATRNVFRSSVLTLAAAAIVLHHGSAKADDLVPKSDAYIQSWDKQQVTVAKISRRLLGNGGEWVITGQVYLAKTGTYKVIGGFTKGYATWHRGSVSGNLYFSETIVSGEAGQTIRFTLRFREPPLNKQMDVKLFTPETKPIVKG